MAMNFSVANAQNDVTDIIDDPGLIPIYRESAAEANSLLQCDTLTNIFYKNETLPPRGIYSQMPPNIKQALTDCYSFGDWKSAYLLGHAESVAGFGSVSYEDAATYFEVAALLSENVKPAMHAIDIRTGYDFWKPELQLGRMLFNIRKIRMMVDIVNKQNGDTKDVEAALEKHQKQFFDFMKLNDNYKEACISFYESTKRLQALQREAGKSIQEIEISQGCNPYISALN